MEYRIIDEGSSNPIDADLGTVWIENPSELWTVARQVFRDELWTGTEDCGCRWSSIPLSRNRLRIARNFTCDDLRQLLADFPDMPDHRKLTFRAERVS